MKSTQSLSHWFQNKTFFVLKFNKSTQGIYTLKRFINNVDDNFSIIT